MNKTILIDDIGTTCRVMDQHTISSDFLYYDELGRARFNTTYTVLGKFVYDLKYRGQRQNASKIVEYIKPELDAMKEMYSIDIVVPVPASEKNRSYQPNYEVAREIAKYLRIRYCEDYLEKTDSSHARDGFSPVGKIKNNKICRRKVNLLLIDDIFSTGRTMRECVKVLKEDPNVCDVHCLALTKTKG